MTYRVIQLLGVLIYVSVVPACHYAKPTHDPPDEAYACHRAYTAITVDGFLNEAAWQKAGVIEAFYIYAPKNGESPAHTSVRMLWDDDYLYVAFKCEDDDIWSYTTEPDGELWRGDVVELFIKPDKDQLPYVELVIAPNGTVFDALHASRGGGGFRRYREWSSGAIVASKVDGTDGRWDDHDTSYCVEAAIPLHAFTSGAEPAEPVCWTFGCFRYDYSKSREEPLLLMSIPESLKRGFHYYEGYRELRLVKDKHASNGAAQKP